MVAGDGNYSFANGPGTSSSFRGAQGLLWLPRGALVVADRFNNRLRVVQGLQDGHAPTNESKPWSPAVTAPRTTSSGKENLRRSAPAKAAPVRVLIWSGHSGPYHDHFVNSEVRVRV